MADNHEEIGKDPKIDSSSKIDEILKKMNSQEQKFDKMAEKLQSMEKSISKIPKSDEKPKSSKKFVLKHVFENVVGFKEGRPSYSENVKQFNSEWFMQVKRNESHLEIHVYCEPVASVDDEWSIDTKLKFKIMGIDENNIIKTMKCRINRIIDSGYEDFPWEEVENHLINDNLTVEVKIEILKMTGIEKKKKRLFDESQKDVSDMVLVVNDIKFYVSKTYLAAQSAFFKTLFLGNFSESHQSEISLSEIDPEDFQCFLEVLYGESAIDDSTVEGILHIADMYATPMVVKKCEEFLLEKSRKSAKELLEVVARYNLESLKKKCMSEIKTVADIRAVLPSDINDLDSRIVAELLEKSLSFH
ncbi:hypothetical protein B9Z55_007729 [Caenorhabditis nigoni]|uniref:BTB domain-containing protein n=1 Tax=Caenorhabditis nigoni TaxID=1611254 RepID=A0A2G5VB04_9PELO|nr:hypothetical protein B9Z55_007729 [Caenorhabditis nigoni]